MKLRNSSAFTIVEIIVVITIVAILSSLAVMTYDSVRKESRDATRQSNATVISEALEKYYEKNGEYPSIASLVNNNAANTGPAVASRLSIPPTSLVMPKMPNTTTNALTSSPTPENQDYIAYESSDTNSTCQSNVSGGCDQFTLTFLQEATDQTRTIESRHSSRTVTLKPELEVSVASISSMSATWSAVSGAQSYELQRSLSASMSSVTTTAHTGTSATITGLAPSTEYFFRVRAVLGGGFSEWSDVRSDTTGNLGAPTGTITITAAMSGTNARGTAGGGTCPAGTSIERQIRYQVNGGTWAAYTTGTPRDVAATEGSTYTFQAQARCIAAGNNGPWAQSTTASVTRSVTAPSGLTIAAAMSGANARGTAGGGACAAGTTIQRQIRYSATATATAGSWSTYTIGSPRDVPANMGWKYTFQQQSRCVGAKMSSGWTTSGTADIVRPITSAPAIPVVSSAISGDNVRFTWGAVACPTGTSTQYNGYETADHSPTTSGWGPSAATLRDRFSYDGHTYTMRVQARCVSTHSIGGYSGWSNTASRLRPVAPPVGVPSGFSHTYYSDSNPGTLSCYGASPGTRKCRMFRWTQPTCRANAVPAYNWNSYMANFAWAATGVAGWRYNPYTAWSGELEYDETGFFWSPSVNTYPSSGMNAILRLRYLCSNRATNQVSGYGPAVQSPGFN